MSQLHVPVPSPLRSGEISVNCPRCESTLWREVATPGAEIEPRLVKNRECMECGTRFRPPGTSLDYQKGIALGVGSLLFAGWVVTVLMNQADLTGRISLKGIVCVGAFVFIGGRHLLRTLRT